MEFKSKSFLKTVEFGKKFGKSLAGGEVILLSGELGSGKTSLTKGIAMGLDIEESVTSPSFAIMNIYQGKLCLYHFDFYRIEDESEMEDLLEGYIYSKEGVTVIEWGEKIIDRLSRFINISFKIYETHRIITIHRKRF